MKNQLGILIILETMVVGFAWAQGPADSEDQCSALRPGNTRFSEGIGVVYARNLPRGIVEEAVDQWTGCRGYGTDFPAFVIGREGTQTVEVTLAMRSAGPRCGSFAGRRIVLYAFARDSSGRLRSCGSRADGLAHELGHILGLLDAPDIELCRDHAMAWVDVTDRNRRSVDAEECRKAGERWSTPTEVATESRPVVVAGID